MSLRLRQPGVPASEPLPPSPFERGRLIGWDDFESASVKYHPFTIGAGTIARSTTNPMFGDFSLKMVTGGVANDRCKISYAENNFHTGMVRTQMGFATQSTSAILLAEIVYYTGTRCYQSILKYETSNNNLTYLGDDGAYHLIDTIEYFAGFAGEIIPYNTIGLVVDLSNRTYYRALFAGREIDLSSYDIFSYPASEDRGILTYWTFQTSAAAAQTAYFDRYRLFEDEPA